jgi:hypothetical protein
MGRSLRFAVCFVVALAACSSSATPRTYGYPTARLHRAALDVAHSFQLRPDAMEVTRTTWARANRVAFPTTNNPNIAPATDVWVLRIRGRCSDCRDAQDRKRPMFATAVAEVRHMAFRMATGTTRAPSLRPLGHVVNIT